MFLHLRSFEPQRGKGPQAVAWAKTLATHSNEAFSPTKPTEVYTELFGENGRIYWATGWQDLAEFERWRAWTRTDQKWAGIAKQHVDDRLAAPGCFRDTLLETT